MFRAGATNPYDEIVGTYNSVIVRDMRPAVHLMFLLRVRDGGQSRQRMRT